MLYINFYIGKNNPEIIQTIENFFYYEQKNGNIKGNWIFGVDKEEMVEELSTISTIYPDQLIVIDVIYYNKYSKNYDEQQLNKSTPKDLVNVWKGYFKNGKHEMYELDFRFPESTL